MKKMTKYTIEQGWNGCKIRKETSGEKFPVWLARVYRWRAEWVTDYTYARHYSPRGARLTVARLLGGEIE